VKGTAMIVKILGSGCPNCNALERATRTALATLGVQASVEHVTDYAQIAAYGVMSTPALVVDGQLLLAGRVPGVNELTALLGHHLTTTSEAAKRTS